jgi:DNA repair protein RadC
MISDASSSPASLSVPWVRVMLVKDAQADYHPAIHSSQEVINLSQDMLSLDREEFRILLLNAKHHVLGVHTVSIGSLTVSIVHPREVYKAAILANAAAIIGVHNHPSGNTRAKPRRPCSDQAVSRGRDVIGHYPPRSCHHRSKHPLQLCRSRAIAYSSPASQPVAFHPVLLMPM